MVDIDAYLNTAKVIRRKLDPKNQKLIFVGYEDQWKDVRLWDNETSKIYVSRDVGFKKKSNRSKAKKVKVYRRTLDVVWKNNAMLKPPTKKINQQQIFENQRNKVDVCVKEIVSISDVGKWQEAVRTEKQSLQSNNTWIAVRKPKGKRVFIIKWVFTIKKSSFNNNSRYKARL